MAGKNAAMPLLRAWRTRAGERGGLMCFSSGLGKVSPKGGTPPHSKARLRRAAFAGAFERPEASDRVRIRRS
jgi:hypothetical protein